MAKKWETQDSARVMTNKYNEVAEEVNDLKKNSGKMNEVTKEAFQQIREDMLRSEPANEDITQDTEETGFITSISVQGTKLIISY